MHPLHLIDKISFHLKIFTSHNFHTLHPTPGNLYPALYSLYPTHCTTHILHPSHPTLLAPCILFPRACSLLSAPLAPCTCTYCTLLSSHIVPCFPNLKSVPCCLHPFHLNLAPLTQPFTCCLNPSHPVPYSLHPISYIL